MVGFLASSWPSFLMGSLVGQLIVLSVGSKVGSLVGFLVSSWPSFLVGLLVSQLTVMSVGLKVGSLVGLVIVIWVVGICRGSSVLS